MEHEAPELQRLAEAVADGTPVDWEEESAANRSLDSRLSRLRLVEKIGAVHRDMVAEFTEPRDSGAAGVPGEAVPGHWGDLEILERVGVGAYGEIFRARDARLQREVALKLLRPRVGDDEAFLAEARRLARVRHPNVLTVHGVDRHGGRIGLWTDLVEGKTLEQVVREQGPLSAEEAALVGIDLCRALAAVHGAGLVHRDVKAANVMRATGGRIVLLDFSAVTERAEGGPALPGTPVYMAPEAFEGRDSGTASDIYSLGVLLYRLVSARYPVEPSGFEDLHRRHRQGRSVPLRDVRPDLPSGFVQVVERALDPDPGRRFRSAGEMESALAATLGTASNERAGAVERRRRDRRLAWALSAAAVAVVGAALWLLLIAPGPGLRVEAALFRAGAQADERLLPGASVEPGDALFLELSGSKPMHVYVLNQDETGRSYVLFPLPALDLRNPLPPGQSHRLPGTLGGRRNHWDVTSAGGEELFVVIASLEPLADLEREIEAIPRAGSAVAAFMDDAALARGLRGVGGLSPDRREPAGVPESLSHLADRLSGRAGGSAGLWVWTATLRGPDPAS